MRPSKPDFKKAKKKAKQIVEEISEYLKVLNVGDIFKNENGKTFAYIKEIQEIGDLTIVRLKGSIDAYTIPVMRASIGNKEERYLNKHILLDFKEVTHVDSSTLAALIQLLNELKMHNRKLGIINATLFLKSYLSITGLKPIVKIYKTEKTALKDLA